MLQKFGMNCLIIYAKPLLFLIQREVEMHKACQYVGFLFGAEPFNDLQYLVQAPSEPCISGNNSFSVSSIEFCHLITKVKQQWARLELGWVTI